MNMRLLAFIVSILSKLRESLFTLALVLLTSLIQMPSEAQELPGQTPEQRPPGQMPELRPVDPLIPFARRWDINGDHISTCEEWKLYMIRIFHKADGNRNKILEESEISNVIAADPIFFDSSLGYFDTNNDDVVARTEFIDRPNPYFFAYDVDKDCRVTESEQETRGK